MHHEQRVLKAVSPKFFDRSNIGTRLSIRLSPHWRMSCCSAAGWGRPASSKCENEKEAGFSLVEVIVALAILALSLAVLLSVISNGIQYADRAEKLARAGTLAQSLLAGIGTEVPIQPGQTAGEFPEGFRWRVRAEPYGDAVDRDHWPVAAYTISVEVLWGEGREERSVALSTLRLAPKEAGR